MRRHASYIVRGIQLSIIVLILLGWVFATGFDLVNPWILPPPRKVLVELSDLLDSGALFPDLATTLFEVAVAFGAAAMFGVLVGYFVGTSRYLNDAFEPVFAGLFAIPLVVFYPLCILYFGLGPTSKIVFGALHGFFPIVLATIVGFAGVNRGLMKASRSMGASNRQMLGLVLLPAALPIVLAGMRIGLTLTFLSVIAAETLGATAGLGHKIVWAAEAMNTARMFAYIAVVVMLAAFLYAAVARFDLHRGSPT